MDSITLTERWIDTKAAADIADYHVKHVRMLARTGRIEAHKVQRDWLVSLSSLLAYKAQMDRLGSSKHNPQAPWRDDLVAEGRGRPGGETERTD